MIFQNEVWLITLSGMGLVALCFLYVISHAKNPTGVAQIHDAHRAFNILRRWLFAALLVLGIVVSYVTLRHFPIPLQHTPLQASQVIDVVASQWQWSLSATRIKAGVPVEFRVTSTDVNHGFAIYGPNGRIVTQTQAMPGFVNKILHTFEQPGTYRILCLEYCGLAHHNMNSEFEVVSSQGKES